MAGWGPGFFWRFICTSIVTSYFSSQLSFIRQTSPRCCLILSVNLSEMTCEPFGEQNQGDRTPGTPLRETESCNNVCVPVPGDLRGKRLFTFKPLDLYQSDSHSLTQWNVLFATAVEFLVFFDNKINKCSFFKRLQGYSFLIFLKLCKSPCQMYL